MKTKTIKSNGISRICERDSKGRIVNAEHLTEPSLIRISGDGTATVQLYGRFGKKLAVIDELDVAAISPYRWYCDGNPTRNTLYVRRSGDGVRMHRFLASAAPSEKVDHRDGDGLNNRRYNLRSTSQIGNSRNISKQRGRISRFKGVTKNKLRWRARIGTSGVRGGPRLHIGSFRTEQEAAMAYDDAARKHFGEFAALNFAKNGERSCLSENLGP